MNGMSQDFEWRKTRGTRYEQRKEIHCEVKFTWNHYFRMQPVFLTFLTFQTFWRLKTNEVDK